MNGMDHYVRFLQDLKKISEKLTLIPLRNDASLKSYHRIHTTNQGSLGSLILMDSSAEPNSFLNFIKVYKILDQNGIRVPKIYKEDLNSYLLLLEDFGDLTFEALLLAKPEKETQIYNGIIKLLYSISQIKTKDLDLPLYNIENLMRELAVFSNWYPKFLSLEPWDNAQLTDISDIFRTNLEEIFNPTNQDIFLVQMILRDFHVANLMYLGSQEANELDYTSPLKYTGTIDFQDAAIGPSLYDLISILEDVRRNVSPKTKEKSIEKYLEIYSLPTNTAKLTKFYAGYNALTIQRNLRILGLFAKKAIHGDRKYEIFIPRIKQNLNFNLEFNSAFKGLKKFLNF